MNSAIDSNHILHFYTIQPKEMQCQLMSFILLLYYIYLLFIYFFFYRNTQSPHVQNAWLNSQSLVTGHQVHYFGYPENTSHH